MTNLNDVLIVTATEFKRNFGKYIDYILTEHKPVYINRHGKIIALMEEMKTKAL